MNASNVWLLVIFVGLPMAALHFIGSLAMKDNPAGWSSGEAFCALGYQVIESLRSIAMLVAAALIIWTYWQRLPPAPPRAPPENREPKMVPFPRAIPQPQD